jgi:hypothetical protein
VETWITELTPLSFLERSADVHPDTVVLPIRARRRAA